MIGIYVVLVSVVICLIVMTVRMNNIVKFLGWRIDNRESETLELYKKVNELKEANVKILEAVQYLLEHRKSEILSNIYKWTVPKGYKVLDNGQVAVIKKSKNIKKKK